MSNIWGKPIYIKIHISYRLRHEVLAFTVVGEKISIASIQFLHYSTQTSLKDKMYKYEHLHWMSLCIFGQNKWAKYEVNGALKHLWKYNNNLKKHSSKYPARILKSLPSYFNGQHPWLCSCRIWTLTHCCFYKKKSFNIPVSVGLTTPAHMLNGYKICLNTTNYLIFNIQDFRYWLCCSILDCFGQLVSPLCTRS